MRALIGIFFATMLAFGADAPHPDQWHGLTLDVSTPADVAALGKPSVDKQDKLPTLSDVGKLLDQELMKKRQLRRMEFNTVEGFKSVDLYFRGEKLVSIFLSFAKPINTEALKNIYGLDFKAYIGGAEASSPEDPNRIFGGGLRRGGLPLYYSMAAFSEKSIVCALVNNNPTGLGEIIKGSPAGGYPGKVGAVMLISRTLEDKAGSDLLK